MSQRCPSHRAQRVTDMTLTLDTVCHRDATHIVHNVTQRCPSHRAQPGTEGPTYRSQRDLNMFLTSGDT
ncbi:hypothetical protein DPMN_108099 [Dreissena polymorpha]|uniref:Uncharacterized protein n=1 Tax=Dreissena polymorpha TaxID=45954 RepID=A0A9D4QKT9_DREPO|nr:hypothetical protein DPMN_108099 [Dreissena polymorpha]